MHITTLKTISDALGISISTVSRALKDHPDISAKTKRRVAELAESLGYEPNASAIHLRTSKSNVFGLVVPAISNYFYHSFIASVEEESRRNGFSLMILQSGDDPQIEMANLKLFRQNRICGIFACISNAQQNIEAYLNLKELDIPVIFFDKVPEVGNCNKVCVADAESATIAAELIVKKNKQQVVGIFGDQQLLITQKRLEAFSGILDDKIALEINFATSSEDAESITMACLATKPDTIFCMSDEILTGVMKAIQRKRLRVPDDISVVAISNGFIPKLYHPEITYVETSGHKLGKLAFSSMMSCMAGSTFVQELTIESLLVEGGSI